MSKKILVVGSINMDTTFYTATRPHPGETVAGISFQMACGGKGANQAVAAAHAGANVKMIGAVGRDAFGTTALSHLQAAGVNTDLIAVLDEAQTGVAGITVDTSGENSIIVIPGANNEVSAAVVTAHAAEIAAADLVIAQGEIPLAAGMALVELAGDKLVLNPAPVQEFPRNCFDKLKMLIVNEHEALLLLQRFGGQTGNPQALMNSLLLLGPQTVVLTLGGAGSMIGTQQGETFTVPAIKVTPVDTTGAGDGFVGALVARLAAGESLATAAQYAAAFAGLAVQQPGAQDAYPAHEQVLAQLAR